MKLRALLASSEWRAFIMLTKRQNFIETVKGGNPDRFVNQYEAIEFIIETPYFRRWGGFSKPEGDTLFVDPWGITQQYREDQPGRFPLHDDEHIVLKDVTSWKETVKFPSLDYDESEWDECKAAADLIDRSQVFASALHVPGVFDQLHYLMGMEECMLSFYTEPEATKELINALTEWELAYAKLYFDYLKPDMVFHHDDWGSQRSTFL